ncbi:MAG: helix-turn-helix domain-containing protein [Ruminococcus sp.]
MGEKTVNNMTLTEILLKNTSNNLLALIKKKNITQKMLANITGVSESTVSEYVNGKKVPPVEFLVRLKLEYGISVDDFVMTESNQFEIPDSAEIIASKRNLDNSNKFKGLYYVYYFDTSNYKGRDDNTPAESLVYGILKIFDSTSLQNGSGCIAVLGLKSVENADEVKHNLDNLSEDTNVFDYVKEHYYANAYSGTFEITDKHAFLSLTHGEKDKALIIFHRTSSNKKYYLGGIGTINSVSKGRESMPVVQYIGISRNSIRLSEEEIHHNLLLDLPKFKAANEAEELINLFRSLYLDKDGHKNPMTELQKTITIKANLERYIKDNLERNIFRYSKISNKDDDEWYHMLKESALIDDNFES